MSSSRKKIDYSAIYKHFDCVSKTEYCPKTKKAEGLFGKLDAMTAKYWNAHDRHSDHIILMALLHLQDLLAEDKPVAEETAVSSISTLVKTYQLQIRDADALYQEETSAQKEILSRVEDYILNKYAHLPEAKNYDALMLVAKFSKMNEGMYVDSKALNHSQGNQNNLRQFGTIRIQQIAQFNQWKESAEFQNAIRCYGHLRIHKVENKGIIPLSKRLELHG